MEVKRESSLVNYSEFEAKIGYVFTNKTLVRQAFTHRSYLNENRTEQLEHNERIEFLGDAVLELAVTEFLFDKFPHKPEGELTALRSALVNTQSLADSARALGINDFLLLSRGEGKDIGRARQIILANALEALIGAIYRDSGFLAAQKFIASQFFGKIDDVVERKLWRDSKSHFQEIAQEKTGITPSDKLLDKTGPDHDKRFTVGVYIGEEQIAAGEGKSKQEAEQDAAQKGLASKEWI